MVATGNSIFMVGVMLGSIIFGQLSDKYGRKLIFFTSLIIQVVFGLIAAFTPEFWTFTIARAVVGATTSGVFLVAYVIGKPFFIIIYSMICRITMSFFILYNLK